MALAKNDNDNNDRNLNLRAWGAVLFLMATASLGLLGYIAAKVVALGESVAEMRGNRWTSKDQSAYMIQHAKEHEDHAKDDHPPDWVKDQLDELEDADRRLQLQIDRLEGHNEKTYN